ncbi:hypothetical protein [Fluviicola sp.]|jgi:hypothetical protein|uniref:hypothetical protein n=1 Tax=Fluviicola sp. TaxID=1917219 RepID=UPI0028294B18|nr:hypothetical protein [Fluviicola sp.]MDR0802095.1 hypothetical protein [Fluviicola sp.]
MNTFDEIIQTKAYRDLTPDELSIVRELVSSEQEFNEMKAFYTEIGQLSVSTREEVSSSVKSSLNAVFRAKHPGIQQHWSTPALEEKKVAPLYNRSWFRIAAIFVISAGIATIWFATREEHFPSKKESVQLAKMEQTAHKTDQKEEDNTTSLKTKKQFPVNEVTSRKYTASSTISKNQSAEDLSPLNSLAAPITYLETDKENTYFLLEKQESTTLSANSPGLSSMLRAEKKSDELSGYFAKAGMDADLNPTGNKESFGRKEVKTPDISTNDLLSLIEPSF